MCFSSIADPDLNYTQAVGKGEAANSNLDIIYDGTKCRINGLFNDQKRIELAQEIAEEKRQKAQKKAAKSQKIGKYKIIVLNKYYF